MGHKVTLNQRRLRQWHLLKMVLEKRMTLTEAPERMEVSYRHAKRLKHVVARDGPKGFVHGNRGRRPANAVGLALKQRLVALSRTEYASFTNIHFTETLATVEGIRIGRETARRIRREAGILPKKRRRHCRHRYRRVRRPHEGMMVLWNGSAHRGFGAQHPWCCLIVPLMMGFPGGRWPDFSPLSLRRDICGFMRAKKRVDLSSVREGHIVEIKVRRIPLFWCWGWKFWDLAGRGFAQSSG